MPTTITQTEIIGRGETLSFIGDTGYLVEKGTQPSLINFGAVLVDVDQAGQIVYAYGLPWDYWGPRNFTAAVFSNELGGAVQVTASQSSAFGVYAFGNPAPDVINRGTLTVSGLDARGVATGEKEWRFLNSGVWRVEATRTAEGLSVGGGTIANSGLFEVAGATAVGVHLLGEGTRSFQGFGDIANSGTIRVTSTSATPSVAILNDSRAATVVNSGLIEADVAFRETTPDATDVILNSGQIHGAIQFGAGDDLIRNTGQVTGNISLGGGDDLYDGAAGTHTGAIFAGTGRDALLGSDGAEVFFGEAGADLISAGGGDDFLDGGAGGDLLDGGAGFDTVSFETASQAVTVNLVAGTAQGQGYDQIRNVERVIGSAFADTMTGGAAAETLEGRAGDDVLAGGAGADVLIGGAGADALTGGASADAFVFTAGDGQDTISDFKAGGEQDRLHIHGYTGYQELRQVGADTLVVLSAGDAILLKNVQASSLSAADFQFNATPLITTPSPQAPVASGPVGDIVDDYANGLGDYVELSGPSGITMSAVPSFRSPNFSNAGTLHLVGQAGVSVVGVNKMSNTLPPVSVGQNLATGMIDVTASGVGNATGVFIGGGGQSFFNAGLITASASGGLAIGAEAQASVGVIDFVNSGTIRASGASAIGVDNGGARFWNTGTIEVSATGTAIGVQSAVMNLGTIRASGGDARGVSINGAGGVFNTGLIEATYAVIVDTPIAATFGSVIYNSGELRGRVSMTDVVNPPIAAWGADEVHNRGTITGLIELKGGADLYDGRAGVQTGGVLGGAGDDRLWGGAAADVLDGGDGADQLSGGAGANTLTGGTGADAFHFESGFGAGTVITDFKANGADVIEVVGYTRYQSLQQQGADTLVVFSAGDSLLLKNVQATSLTAADFKFSAAALPASGWQQPPATPTAPPAAPSSASVPIMGTGAGETLNGGAAAEAIFGLAGDDRIVGGAGDDQLVGGAGADTFVYSAGHGQDVIYDFDAAQGDVLRLEGFAGYQQRIDGADLILTLSDGGTITLRGGAQTGAASGVELGTPPGLTVKEGGAGADTLDGAAGRELLRGGLGADVLHGLAGSDWLEGGRGDDLLDGGTGNDDLIGGLGADTFVFRKGDGIDDIRDFNPGQGDVIRLEGFNAYDIVQSENGDVTISGLFTGVPDTTITVHGATLAQVQAAIDLVPAMPTAAPIAGSQSGELLDGTSGGERIEALAGRDQIRGLAGDDVIDGGAGDDIIEGGAGNDDLTGGQGADLFVYRPGSGDDLIRDFNAAEGDQLRLEGYEGFVVSLRQNGTDVLVVPGDGRGSINLRNTTVAEVQAAVVSVSWVLTDYGYQQVSGTEASNTLNGGPLPDAIAGYGGADVINGADGNDLLSGGAGDDVLNGGAGIDYISGDEGVDQMTGGAGRDYFIIMSGSGRDTVADFNVAEDVIDIRRTDVASIVQQGADTLLTFGTGDSLVLKNVNAGTLQVSNFIGGTITPPLVAPPPPPIAGTPNAETLTGTAAGERINGLAGDDVLNGLGGDDTLDGGDGDDLLQGGAGNDLLIGGAGIDTASYADVVGPVHVDLTGAETSGPGADVLVGVENLIGSAFDDALWGDAGANRLAGGGGGDVLFGGAGDDRLEGGDGDDWMDGGEGADWFDGGAGMDTVTYASATAGVTVSLLKSGAQATGAGGSDTLVAIENLTGSAFNDVLRGNSGANILAGGGGDDLLDGGAGVDRLFGGDGFDTATYANAATAVRIDLTTGVHTGEAAGDMFVEIERFALSRYGDQFTGSIAADQVFGDLGNDTLFGAAGNDVLDGGGGDDILRGGLGADRLIGGAGTDQANYQLATAAVSINLATGVHTGEAAGDTFESIERFVLSRYADQFAGSAGADDVTGDSGNDTLFGGAGNDRLDGGTNNDVLRGGEGADQLIGGTGTDVASYQVATAAVTVNLTTGVHTGEAAGDTFDSIERFALSNFNDTFVGGDGADRVDGWKGNDTLYGGGGNDDLNGYDGNDFLYGGADNDKLRGDRNADELHGDAGADVLYGGTGNDRLFGGDDGDYLWGDEGDDVLTGGAGADRFAFTTGSGFDVVTDFRRGQDKIVLKGIAGVDDFSDLRITTDAHGWAVISWGDGSASIALTGIAAGQLTASDIWFTG